MCQMRWVSHAWIHIPDQLAQGWLLGCALYPGFRCGLRPDPYQPELDLQVPTALQLRQSSSDIHTADCSVAHSATPHALCLLVTETFV